ncbi:zinc finger CCCH domain-containing protein 4-like [Penaeus indicus]|uniref:zinc finger CCCH domain-containing protein 4-like n=1 Tax=Penaeus indicus TaxID=29960 RepID=UPI00300C0302
MEESHLNPQGEEEEEKEEGELEDGELEDEEEEEPQQQEGSGKPEEPAQEPEDGTAGVGGVQGSSPSRPNHHHHHHHHHHHQHHQHQQEEDKEGGKEGELGAEEGPLAEGDHKGEEEGRKREGKSGKEERKRKHKDDDEEREKRRKKKKKRKHVSSDEEDDDLSPVPKFHRKMMPQPFDGNMGFDAMLQQEMYLRGRSPPPGMMPYGPPPPGAFGPPHPMFRGHPMSDFDSYDSGSDSEMRERRRRRRRHRRSRSRSRSPSFKNEAICMYYMQGSCKRGKACPYSHDIQPQRKMELCKFYMMDCCAKKEKCLYMHKDFPCKYYHTGLRCKLAAKCKFSHGQLSDSAKQILLKHIELAPKDILGDFPRLTKEAAQLVVDITEGHRRGQPLNVENIPGIMDMKGRGFKYVDKAIRALEKKQEKNLLKEQGEQDQEEGQGGAGAGDGGSLDHPQQHYDQQQHHQHHQHSHQQQQHQHASKQEKLPKHSREEQEGIASPRHGGTPPHMNEMVNGEGQQPGFGGQGGNSSHMGPNPGRKLGRFMAGMPQKQRELFQRIQQQHSVHDDQEEGTGEMGGMDDSAPGTSNVNWYSSDEEGDGSSPTKSHAQSAMQSSNNLSPSRTPPLPHQTSATSPSHGGMTPPGRPGSSPGSSASSTTPKTPFSNINLANINISSDLASVLSALKSQNAASTNRSSDESGRGPVPQSPRRRDPREMPRELSQDMSRDPREVSRDFRDMNEQRDLPRSQSHGSRDPRADSQRLDSDYSQSPWMRDQQSMGGRWDSQRDLDSQKEGRGLRGSFSESRDSGDLDQRQRTGDVDLRVLPGIEDSRPQGQEVKGLTQDTDMRISSEPSIYDVDLRQLNLPGTFKDNDEDPNSLPFKVPVHTPAKEIVASISSHSPMYYQLVKVCIPKPNFSHLKINKDDPKILEDPRLRKMLRRNSTEDSSKGSPRTPSRYEFDGPMSPPPYVAPSKSEPKPTETESRDPRMSGSRDPRAEPRGDPRSEPRAEPRGDPRVGTRSDPRMGSRGDPRTESRDPRSEPMGDMRNQDPRMFGGGNGGGMMDGGGMPFNNMGPGPMGGMIPPRNVDPRGRPGLLGPAPMAFPSNVPPGMGPRMPPYMMGQMGPGPNGGFYPDEGNDMMGGGGYPQGGPGWGGRMMSNDPRLKRDMSDGGRSYTPPPVS